MRSVRAFDEQRARLEAGESILFAQRVGVAIGSMGDAGTQLVKAWQRERDGDADAKPPHRTAKELRTMGIKVFGPNVSAD